MVNVAGGPFSMEIVTGVVFREPSSRIGSLTAMPVIFSLREPTNAVTRYTPGGSGFRVKKRSLPLRVGPVSPEIEPHTRRQIVPSRGSVHPWSRAPTSAATLTRSQIVTSLCWSMGLPSTPKMLTSMASWALSRFSASKAASLAAGLPAGSLTGGSACLPPSVAGDGAGFGSAGAASRCWADFFRIHSNCSRCLSDSGPRSRRRDSPGRRLTVAPGSRRTALLAGKRGQRRLEDGRHAGEAKLEPVGATPALVAPDTG